MVPSLLSGGTAFTGIDIFLLELRAYSKKSFPLKAATPPASGHNGVSSLTINNTLDGGPRFGLEYDIAVPLLRDC